MNLSWTRVNRFTRIAQGLGLGALALLLGACASGQAGKAYGNRFDACMQHLETDRPQMSGEARRKECTKPGFDAPASVPAPVN